MKNKDLIEQLQQLDPEAEVCFRVYTGGPTMLLPVTCLIPWEPGSPLEELDPSFQGEFGLNQRVIQLSENPNLTPEMELGIE